MLVKVSIQISETRARRQRWRKICRRCSQCFSSLLLSDLKIGIYFFNNITFRRKKVVILRLSFPNITETHMPDPSYSCLLHLVLRIVFLKMYRNVMLVYFFHFLKKISWKPSRDCFV